MHTFRDGRETLMCDGCFKVSDENFPATIRKNGQHDGHLCGGTSCRKKWRANLAQPAEVGKLAGVDP